MIAGKRSLDHCVLPVAALDDARQRLGAMGFTVAPQGTHPFGTVNACVYFADGTFLEPLAIGNALQAMAAEAAGNAFIAGDSAYRAAHDASGFSAIVMSSNDADADDAAFRAAGFGGGRRLDFSRPFRTPDGAEGEASFRLAFASPEDGRDSYFFACERVNAPKVDRSALETHANGVTGIARVLLTADRPADHEDFLAVLTGVEPETTDGILAARLPDASVEIVTPEAFETLVRSEDIEPASGLKCRAIVFRCEEPAAIAALAGMADIAFKLDRSGVIIDPAPGQGAHFIFEAATP